MKTKEKKTLFWEGFRRRFRLTTFRLHEWQTDVTRRENLVANA